MMFVQSLPAWPGLGPGTLRLMGPSFHAEAGAVQLRADPVQRRKGLSSAGGWGGCQGAEARYPACRYRGAGAVRARQTWRPQDAVQTAGGGTHQVPL